MSEISCVRIDITADLVIFTEEILNGKPHFLCSVLEDCNPQVDSKDIDDTALFFKTTIQLL